MTRPHVAFVTGCATGFGHRLAARLLARGDRVVATDQRVDRWAEQLGAPRRDLLALPCDVRDDAAVREAVATAAAWGPVDVVVANAGHAVFGTVEEVDVARVEALFDVNVLGVVRVVRALLPTLREHRGQIVLLSSVAGRTVFPESGFYAATKHAVEAIGEALAQEVAAFGVRVRLIEPGSFDTEFLPTALRLSPARDPDSAYAALRPGWDARKLGVLEPPQDPERVVDAIVAALDDPTPFLRVPVGPDAVRILRLRDALGPDRWTRLAADRAGLQAPHRDGEVPYPEDLLAAVAAGGAVPEVVRVAYASGHLEHWAESEVGRTALALLSR